MSEELKRFQELVDDVWELVFGTVRRPEVKFKDMMKKATDDKDWETVRSGEDRRSKDRGTSDRRLNGTKIKEMTKRAKGYTKEHTQLWLDSVKDPQVKPKRARTKKGTYRADDKSTKEFNEAWVGGKAPKKKKRKK